MDGWKKAFSIAERIESALEGEREKAERLKNHGFNYHSLQYDATVAIADILDCGSWSFSCWNDGNCNSNHEADRMN